MRRVQARSEIFPSLALSTEHEKLAGEATHPDDASEAGDEAGRKTSRLWIAGMFLFELFLLNFKFSLPFSWPMA